MKIKGETLKFSKISLILMKMSVPIVILNRDPYSASMLLSETFSLIHRDKLHLKSNRLILKIKISSIFY